jgi:orotate phosphoribosyltransferase
VTEADLRRLLEEVGAVRRGHFLLTSGRHGTTFFQLARLFERPDLTEAAVALLCRGFDRRDVSCVVGPAMGGVILAYETARRLGARAVYTEKDADGAMRLRRGFRFTAGEPVLVVEDALTTGGSVARCLSAVEGAGARPVGVAVLVRRSDRPLPFALPVTAATVWRSEDFLAEECPACARGEALSRPKEQG